MDTAQEKIGKLEDRMLVTKLKHTEKKNWKKNKQTEQSFSYTWDDINPSNICIPEISDSKQREIGEEEIFQKSNDFWIWRKIPTHRSKNLNVS